MFRSPETLLIPRPPLPTSSRHFMSAIEQIFAVRDERSPIHLIGLRARVSCPAVGDHPLGSVVGDWIGGR